MFHSVSLLSQAPLARGSRALPSVLLGLRLEFSKISRNVLARPLIGTIFLVVRQLSQLQIGGVSSAVGMAAVGGGRSERQSAERTSSGSA